MAGSDFRSVEDKLSRTVVGQYFGQAIPATEDLQGTDRIKAPRKRPQSQVHLFHLANYLPAKAFGAVLDPALERIKTPVLVVHHKQDSCRASTASEVPGITGKLKHLNCTDTLLFNGGKDEGDACEAFAYHGYNGIEAEVVKKISAWIKNNS
mgnify:CR=1 FL=1